jgi:hypothetical protein
MTCAMSMSALRFVYRTGSRATDPDPNRGSGDCVPDIPAAPTASA